MVEHEAKVLPTLSHPNIISVLDIGERPDITPKLTYIVEPLISGAKPFFTHSPDNKDTWLVARVDQLRKAIPQTDKLEAANDVAQSIELIGALLSDVATLFSQWVSLLAHLHGKHDGAECGYIYLDVKPENVLVDDHLHLTSIDYGSVEEVSPGDSSPAGGLLY